MAVERAIILGVLFVAIASATPAPRVLLLDAARAGPDVIAVGERGTILRSADSGVHWSSLSVSSDARATLTGVAFAPNSPHGWAVGHDALILATTDGGRTWQKQWQGDDLEASFLDVCAIDAQHVVAIGAYGFARTTTDGGKTWSKIAITEDDAHLNRITRAADGTLYVAGERGTLLRSCDAAKSWERLETPYDGSYYGVLPLGPRSLLVYGLRGHVFRSTDDATTWQPVHLDRPVLIATALKPSIGPLWIAGQTGALHVSHDDGATFAVSAVELTAATAELLEAPDGTLLAFGEAGAIRLLSDVAAPVSVRSAPLLARLHQ